MPRIPRQTLTDKYIAEVVTIPGYHPPVGIRRIDLLRVMQEAGCDARDIDWCVFGQRPDPDVTEPDPDAIALATRIYPPEKEPTE